MRTNRKLKPVERTIIAVLKNVVKTPAPTTGTLADHHPIGGLTLVEIQAAGGHPSHTANLLRGLVNEGWVYVAYDLSTGEPVKKYNLRNMSLALSYAWRWNRGHVECDPIPASEGGLGETGFTGFGPVTSEQSLAEWLGHFRRKPLFTLGDEQAIIALYEQQFGPIGGAK